MSGVLAFTVVGIPQTKGSSRAFVITPRGGGRPRAVVTNDNPKTKGWQQTIAEAVAVTLVGDPIRPRFLDGPVAVEVIFHLPRPKALLTRSKAGQIIPHTKKPDLDKLARACKDALTGVVWNDDAQVTDLIARKRYCAADAYPRAEIRIYAADAAGGQPCSQRR